VIGDSQSSPGKNPGARLGRFRFADRGSRLLREVALLAAGAALGVVGASAIAFLPPKITLTKGVTHGFESGVGFYRFLQDPVNRRDIPFRKVFLGLNFTTPLHRVTVEKLHQDHSATCLLFKKR
jgi:hypothetical protein